jgi:hypothetical protein
MGALLIQHPSAPVEFQADCTATPDSIAAAFKFNCAAREEAGIPLLPVPACVKPSALYQPMVPTQEQIEMLEATDGLYNLIQKYGADRVMWWVKTLATIAGKAVDESVYIDRPADRCLADGAPLVNSICTRCGCDNS